MKKKWPLLFVIISTIILALIVIFIDSINVSFFDSWFYNETVETMTPSLTLAMRFITESGGSIAIVVLCLSLFLFPKTRKDWALPVSTTVVIATTSNLVLKLIFARERPDIMRLIDEYNYSFPSGHAMINMAFYIIILLLTWRHVPNKSAKYALTFICIIMPLIIGFSRIYLGVHYATDVIAGWLLGFSVAVIVYSWFYRGKNEV
jgi:undecaprenyl-diphosphatase